MGSILPFGRHHPTVAPDAFVADTARVIGRVTLGARASVWYGAVLRGDINEIQIGAESGIQDGAVLHLADDHPCILGPRVTVGHQATVHACTVDEGALIGIGAIVLDGAHVGALAMIAAGALVPPGKSIPPRVLAVGVPARVVRDLTDDEIAENLWRVEKYVRLSRRHMGKVAGPLLREEGWVPRMPAGL